jgi:quercetin dioxygenase-like cupin family protein
MNKQYAMGCALFAAGVLAGVLAPRALQAQSAGLPATKMILHEDLVNLPGQEVMVFTSDWAPGDRLPLHRHPEGHEFVYVVEGEQTFEIEGVGVRVVHAGEILHTQPNVAHFGRNATGKLSKTVVFRIKDKNQPIAVEVRK